MIYIGIGGCIEQRLPLEILKLSILKHSKSIINFIDLSNISLNNKYSFKKQRTPFSYQRFLFAELCLNIESTDVAIYLDSDMIVFSDINDLASIFLESKLNIMTVKSSKYTTRRSQSSVIVFNKRGAINLVEYFNSYNSDQKQYDEIFYLHKEDGWEALDPTWNSLEFFTTETKLLHFTDMDYQPWLSRKNPLRGLWECFVLESICKNENFKSIFLNELSKKNIRPSLAILLNTKLYCSNVSLKLIFEDFLWIPPHRMQLLKSLKVNKYIMIIFYITSNIFLSLKNKKNGIINQI